MNQSEAKLLQTTESITKMYSFVYKETKSTKKYF